MSLQRVPFEKSLMPSPSHLLATHHSPLFPPTCPEDSFGTGFLPVLFSAPGPVSFSSHHLLPFLDEHGFSTRRVDPERSRRATQFESTSSHSEFLATVRHLSRLSTHAFLVAGPSLSTLNC